MKSLGIEKKKKYENTLRFFYVIRIKSEWITKGDSSWWTGIH